MKLKLLLSALLLGGTRTLFAQEEVKNPPLTIGGYVEAYYVQDFNRPLTNNRPGFTYSHHRTNEVNLNLAFVNAAYSTENVRANFAIAAGSYMNANYSAEPGVLKNLFDANVGVKISKKHQLWIDAGVFPSHIGFESAIGKDNWTLTRSLCADNSPYFETGAKLSYTSPNEKWFVGGLVLNGWQRIQRPDGNSTPAFGHQLTYKPNERFSINSSSFIGNDKPDSVRQMRYFHNIYSIFQITERFGLIGGFDIGVEQKQKGSKQYNNWFTPVVIARYSPSEKISIAARGEYYQDKNGVIIATGTPNGFKTYGYSVNADWSVFTNVVARAEIRNLQNKDAIFINNKNDLRSNSFAAIMALAISF